VTPVRVVVGVHAQAFADGPGGRLDPTPLAEARLALEFPAGSPEAAAAFLADARAALAALAARRFAPEEDSPSPPSS
jgi:hypothetical protein